MNQANTSPETLKLLARVKERLQAAWGDRLRGVLLYGSQARGEQAFTSDVDVHAYEAGEYSWFRNAKREGILV